jgi:hypothetical protein
MHKQIFVLFFVFIHVGVQSKASILYPRDSKQSPPGSQKLTEYSFFILHITAG